MFGVCIDKINGIHGIVERRTPNRTCCVVSDINILLLWLLTAWLELFFSLTSFVWSCMATAKWIMGTEILNRHYLSITPFISLHGCSAHLTYLLFDFLFTWNNSLCDITWLILGRTFFNLKFFLLKFSYSCSIVWCSSPK